MVGGGPVVGAGKAWSSILCIVLAKTKIHETRIEILHFPVRDRSGGLVRRTCAFVCRIFVPGRDLDGSVDQAWNVLDATPKVGAIVLVLVVAATGAAAAALVNVLVGISPDEITGIKASRWQHCFRCSLGRPEIHGGTFLGIEFHVGSTSVKG